MNILIIIGYVAIGLVMASLIIFRNSQNDEEVLEEYVLLYPLSAIAWPVLVLMWIYYEICIIILKNKK